MEVEIYMNIRKFNRGEPFWSVRNKKTGKVIQHKEELVVKNCWFTVQPAGRDKVRKQKRKNVHAWVNGTIMLYSSLQLASLLHLNESHYPIEEGRHVSYNPYTYDHFEVAGESTPEASGGREIAAADLVHLTSTGRIYVYGSLRLRR